MEIIKIYKAGICTDPFWMGICSEMRMIIPDITTRKVSHKLEGGIDPTLRLIIQEIGDNDTWDQSLTQ